MDRATGLRQGGWDNVIQAIEILLTTRYFERVLREYVGSPVPAPLAELANVRTVIRFQWSVAAVILLFEPRFTPTRISPLTLDRSGASDWVIEGIGCKASRPHRACHFRPFHRRIGRLVQERRLPASVRVGDVAVVDAMVELEANFTDAMGGESGRYLGSGQRIS
jgi:hypothetical protein